MAQSTPLWVCFKNPVLKYNVLCGVPRRHRLASAYERRRPCAYAHFKIEMN